MISIIIPSYNEEKFLPRLLDSLVHQNTKKPFEVILVDGSSEDKTIKYAKTFQKRLPLRLIIAKKRGAAYQRNEGIRTAKGDWMVFVDADNRLPPNFIENFHAATLTNAFDIAIFKATIQKKWGLRFKIIFNLIDVLFKIWRKIGVSVQHGGCIAIRTSSLQYRFDTDVEILEDYIFVYNNAKAGARYEYLDDISFTMSLRRFKRDGLVRTLLQNSWHLISFALFKKRFLRGVNYSMDGGTNYRSEHTRN